MKKRTATQATFQGFSDKTLSLDDLRNAQGGGLCCANCDPGPGTCGDDSGSGGSGGSGSGGSGSGSSGPMS